MIRRVYIFAEIDQGVLIEFNRNLESRMYYENQI